MKVSSLSILTHRVAYNNDIFVINCPIIQKISLFKPELFPEKEFCDSSQNVVG